MMKSSYFLLEERIQNGIRDTLKWDSFTSIQEETIPYILNGDNCVLIAQTAGGKTEAAFLPIINQIYKENTKPISVIYISPIRALLNNQELRLKKLGKIAGIDAFKWHGEVEYTNKKKFAIGPKHIIATTPESLEVLLMSDSYDNELLFSNIRFVVIDEIHYFAENYRGSQLISIIERIQTYSKYDIQRVGLSATIGNPEEILNWMCGSSHRSKTVIKSSGTGKKSKVFIRYFEEFNPKTISRLLPELKEKKSLFFCNSRTNSEMMAKILKEIGIDAKVHHSSISKNLRDVSEEKLKSSKEMCLCCTSTMELGIDVGDLDVIMQFDSPSTVASFRQRMGRTGRRKGTQSHYEFCVQNALALLNAIAIVELARKQWVESAHTATSAYTVLFQQIISMILQKYGVREEYLKEIVLKSSCFQNIDELKFKKFIDYLISKNFLECTNNEYILGNQLEEKYEFNLLLNFISVFETIPEFSIIYRNKEIGTLQSWFIYNSLKENKGVKFTLAGITWQVDKIDYEKNKIYVKKAEEGGLPVWFGGGQTISYEVAKQMLHILNSNEEYAYIDNKAKSTLQSMRIEHSALGIKENEIIVDVIKDGFDIYTYAGNKVNFTLGLLINYEYNLDFSVSYHKLKVKRDSNKITEQHIGQLLNKFANNEKIIEGTVEKALITSDFKSPSKYYDILPRFAQIEILKHEMVDIKNTCKLLKESQVIVENLYNTI